MTKKSTWYFHTWAVKENILLGIIHIWHQSFKNILHGLFAALILELFPFQSCLFQYEIVCVDNASIDCKPVLTSGLVHVRSKYSIGSNIYQELFWIREFQTLIDHTHYWHHRHNNILSDVHTFTIGCALPFLMKEHKPDSTSIPDRS